MSEVENKTEQEALDKIKGAMARALKAGKWMVGVLWVENGKVEWHQTPWKFPLKGHEVGVKSLAEAVEKSMATEVSPPGPLPECLDFLSQEQLVGANQNESGKEEEKPEAPPNREVRQESNTPKEVDPFDGPGAPVVSDPVVDGDPTAGKPEGVLVAETKLHSMGLDKTPTDPFTGNGPSKIEKPETKDEKDAGLDT